MALDEVAALAVRFDSGRQALHLQVRAQGSRRPLIDAVPDLAAVRETARDVQRLARQVADDDPGLLQVTWLNAAARRGGQMPVRTPDPLDELHVRIDRLRQAAWAMIAGDGTPPVSQESLAAFAAAGVGVNTSAAVVGARLAGVDVRDPAVPGPVRDRLAKADAWRDVRGGLLRLRTIAPVERAVVAEASSLLRLVSRMVPAERGDGALGRREWEPQVRGALATVAESMDQIAAWNAQALDRAAACSGVFLPGRLLTGDQVTNDPGLVVAKLADAPVLAPEDVLAALRGQYRRAAATLQSTAPAARPAAALILPSPPPAAAGPR